jgi:hypothetical protein
MSAKNRQAFIARGIMEILHRALLSACARASLLVSLPPPLDHLG